jgi:hypothetical protein
VFKDNFEKGNFYLGDKKILSQEDVQNLSISNIKEILLSNYIKDKSVLIYDIDK